MTSGRPSRYIVAAVAIIVLAGLTARFALLPAATRIGYLPDHDDFVRWGMQAANNGTLTVYDEPPPRMIMRVWNGNSFNIETRTLDRKCNYPPGAVYLLSICGHALQSSQGTDALVNTDQSRTIFAIPGIIADLLLAAGCAFIALRLGNWRRAVIAFGLVFLMPPLIWDTVIWGQVDSWVLAPAVWMLAAMMSRRWILAGVLLGIAAALKTQALFLLPLWAFALIWDKQFLRPIAGLATATAVLALAAAPFMLHTPPSSVANQLAATEVTKGSKALPDAVGESIAPDAPDVIAPDAALGATPDPDAAAESETYGALAWLHSSYTENFTAYRNTTTLAAFNVWYLDALLRDSLESDVPLGSMSRNRVGLISTLVMLAVVMVVIRVCFGTQSRGLLTAAVMTLITLLMFMTGMHERYMMLALPFLAVAAAVSPRWTTALVLFALVAMCQVTWPQWQRVPIGAGRVEVSRQIDKFLSEGKPLPRGISAYVETRQQFYERAREESVALEWVATCLALLALLAGGAAAISTAPNPCDDAPDKPDSAAPINPQDITPRSPAASPAGAGV